MGRPWKDLSLLGWRASQAIAIGLEAIARSSEAIEASIASRLDVFALRLEAVAIQNSYYDIF